MKKLDDDQLKTFDTDYAREERWDALEAAISASVEANGGQPVEILDVGGGNGAFADKLINKFECIHVTVLDNAEVLLDKNVEHPRKSVVLSSAADLSKAVGNKKYDLITYNWVLHHLVRDSYSDTREGVVDVLNQSRALLKVNGAISIFENNFDGMLIDNLPSRIIFHLTSISGKLLSTILRRAGANTAGVGVCFRSQKDWISVFNESGLSIQKTTQCDTLQYPKFIRMAMGTKPVKVVHYVVV